MKEEILERCPPFTGYQVGVQWNHMILLQSELRVEDSYRDTSSGPNSIEACTVLISEGVMLCTGFNGT